jgi:hypothetical protein
VSEAIPLPFYKRTLVYRVLHWMFQPAYARRKHRQLMEKWAHHADARSFAWDWDAPNFNRIALVNLLLAKKAGPSYLEIGCADNSLFDSVPVARKTGVDPQRGGTHRTTSDAFFAQNQERFDVIFIDGLHTYEQVRKDVVNSIECLAGGGWVAMHDMLPKNWIEQHIPVISATAWTGDVWKVAFELASTDGVDFKILKIDRGVGVFRVTKRDVRLNDRFQSLRDQKFSFLYDNIKELPLIDWQDAQEWLRS